MTVLSPLDEAVRDISLAQHLPRIKKLLVYACTQHWETDPRQLATYHLHDLLEALLHRAPTLEQLQAHLYQLTECLSKPAEYTLIANLIIEQLRPLYDDSDNPIESPTPTGHHSPVCDAIAHRLAQEAQALRIKKLLVLLCRSVWERDPQRLDSIPWESLVRELHQRAQTPDQLRAALNSAVRTLNKRTEYGAIARTILRACEPLYLETPHPQGESQPAGGVPTATVTAAAAMPATVANGSSLPTVPPGSSGQLVVKELDELSWFELRLETMKYTNPLLAKQLLLAVIYPAMAREQGNQSPANWQATGMRALREHDLGALLRQFLLPGYSLTELEAVLHTAVRQLNSPQHYPQVATALLRIIRPVLVPAKSPWAARRPPGQTDPHLQTCQIAASTTLLERGATTPQDHLQTNLESNPHSHDPTLGMPSTNPRFSPASDGKGGGDGADGKAIAALPTEILETPAPSDGAIHAPQPANANPQSPA